MPIIGSRVTDLNHVDVSGAWNKLLKSEPSEREVQDFLERHPRLLPGLLDLHNGLLHDVIVSNMPFGPNFVSDFAFVSRHSMALQFTFVEIQSPTKSVFNKDDSFTQAFNHARQQLADSKVWVEKNIPGLMDMYGPMFQKYNAYDDHKDFMLYLVCGRCHEVERNRRRKERWSSLRTASATKVRVMSYDRLRLTNDEPDDLIVCTYEQREFYAKSSVI